ncbi:MAG: hypothetical protein HKN07_08265 [Acidimicrobiia bacterium]|nr:hypothetical protein [Acidimicrobiia bacterium]NNF64242.1 hypothetical protein [Acidimicrobiia bacterium]
MASTVLTADEPVAAPLRTRITLPDSRLFAYSLVGAVSLLMFVVVSGSIEVFRPQGSFPFFSADFDWPALFTANTPTGGDSGAHVFLPAELRDNLLTKGRILGWSNDWYAGFPVLYFYFPLPALVTVLLDVVIPYGVSFKIVQIAGLVASPWAVYYFVRSLGFHRLIAAVGAVGGSLMLFMESYSIFGANVKSTLAGEFSFSWSFVFSLLFLGMISNRRKEGFTPGPGVLLAFAALSHLVTTAVVVIASLVFLGTRMGRRAVIGSWILGFAITAFWSIPLLVRLGQGFTTDMGWSPVEGILGEPFPGTVATPFPDEIIPYVALAFIGLIWSLMRRERIASLLVLTFVGVGGYFLIPLTPETIVYNARLLPFWYFGLLTFAGLGVGFALDALLRWLPNRQRAVAFGAGAVGVLFVGVIVIGMHDLPGWVRWNFTGYEGKSVFNEYETLIETVDALPGGRVMWEVNSDQNRYGTPMALMLLPYWSEDHPSMEGVFFESSITTPFHFLNASEVSYRPSNPVRGLDYRGLDFARAEAHLPVYGIEYYVSFTQETADAARAQGWQELANPEPWTVFAAPESQLVDVATHEVVVWDGEAEFREIALSWYDDVDMLDRWLLADGPDEFARVGDLVELENSEAIATSGSVTNIEIEDDRLSFDTDAIGVPHLVKISHFPNWRVTGAEGPYRAAPSLMVVIPTDSHVELSFGYTADEYLGLVLTFGALVFLATTAVIRRRSA